MNEFLYSIDMEKKKEKLQKIEQQNQLKQIEESK